jgi:4-amino-4-deoxy-L-arabinose transferase-like glycosyltransferase
VTKRTSDGFRVVLGFIAFFGFLMRTLYLMVATGELGGDGRYYHAIAKIVADGKGFISPEPYELSGRIIASSPKPPAWPLILAAAHRLGLHSAFGQQMVACVIGTATIIIVAFAGRRIAGDSAGLIAAVIAATYPNFWLYERELMSETLTLFGAALVVLSAYRFRDQPSRRRAVALGFSCGLLAINHAEHLLLVAFLVVPLTLATRDQPRDRRIKWAALATVCAIAALVPWAAYNSTRFHTFVPSGTANGKTVLVSNCSFTYSGSNIGFQDERCVKRLDGSGQITGKNEAIRDRQYLSIGQDYIRGHLSRLPIVIAAREGRLWSVFNAGQQTRLDTGRNTSIKVIEAGYFMYWALVPAAVLGGVALRRRRVMLLPLTALLLTIAVSAASSYGFTRFRAAGEVAIVLLAAVAIDAVIRRRFSARAEKPTAGIPSTQRADLVGGR